MTDIQTLKNWFKTKLKPTQEQFWAFFDSYWHKSEKIPTSSIEGLSNTLANKVDKIDGKGLSSNDYTTTEKNKLAGLQNFDPTLLEQAVAAKADLVGGKVPNEQLPEISAGIGKSDQKVPTGITRVLDLIGAALQFLGLVDKSTDPTVNKFLVKGSDGILYESNGSQQVISAVDAMTDAQIDALRIASRKSNETYSLGQPRVDFVTPPLLDNSLNYINSVYLIGANLFLNNTTSGSAIVKMKRIKDVAGNLVNEAEQTIENITVYQTDQSTLSFGLNFNNYLEGEYAFTVIHNGISSASSSATINIRNLNGVTSLPLNLTWTEASDGSSVDYTQKVLSNTSITLKQINSQSSTPGYIFRTWKSSALPITKQGFYIHAAEVNTQSGNALSGLGFGITQSSTNNISNDLIIGYGKQTQQSNTYPYLVIPGDTTNGGAFNLFIFYKQGRLLITVKGVTFTYTRMLNIDLNMSQPIYFKILALGNPHVGNITSSGGDIIINKVIDFN